MASFRKTEVRSGEAPLSRARNERPGTRAEGRRPEPARGGGEGGFVSQKRRKSPEMSGNVWKSLVFRTRTQREGL